MKTNLVLDDDLVQTAMLYSDAKSEDALVKEALQTYVRVKAEEQRNSDYWQRLEKLQSKLQGLWFTESAHDLVRADRDR